jgi:hypothetical protein
MITSPAHAVIEQLEKCCNQDLKAMPQSERYPFIARQIEKAQAQYRICATADLMLFCRLALAGGADFDRAPAVAHVLERVVREDISFGKAYWQDFPAQSQAANARGGGASGTACC